MLTVLNALAIVLAGVAKVTRRKRHCEFTEKERGEKQKLKMSNKPIICFDISKNERFQITDNYKTLHRKLKANWTVEQ